MRVPDVSYARSGPVSIAYQVVEGGPADVVWVRGGLDDMLSTWERPEYHEIFAEITCFARLLLFDKRGSGLSDPAIGGLSLEARMDDVRAVMDAADSAEAVLFAQWEGARLALMFAATYPERTRGLVLVDAAATDRRSAEHPWGASADEANEIVRAARERWGRREVFAEWFPTPDLPASVDADEFFEWKVRHLRRAASPYEAAEFWRAAYTTDVTDILSSVRVPTTVIRYAREPGPSRFLADRIPDARYLEIESAGGMMWLWSPRRADIVGEIRSRAEDAPDEPDDRVLATVLFTDLVGSTERAAAMGDRAWSELVQRHHALVRQELVRFRGGEVDTAGDGFFATFDGPARAIRCAQAVVERLAGIGLEVRAGIHTGECELSNGKLAGVAVNLGARVSAVARPGEVLVTSTVRDLVSGSGLRFEDRGEHTLKGVPSPWRLYRVLQNEKPA